MLTFDDPPFGDVADPQTRTLVDLLSQTIYTEDTVAAMLRVASLNPGAYTLRPAGLAWVSAVPDAAKHGTLRTLIEYVCTTQPAFGTELTRRMQDVTAPAQNQRWYAYTDPFTAAFVGRRGARIVIDRSELRSSLRDLVNDEYLVLVVHGDPRSGKSHTWEFVDHLWRAGRLLRATRVTTHDWSGEVTGDAIAQSLALKLALPLPTTTSGELDDARVRKFLQHLVGVYPTAGATRWIILDGLDRPGVTDGARDLARGLIRLVNEGELPHTRLIVTGLDPFGLHLGHNVLIERIPGVDRHLLDTFLHDVAAHLGQVPAPTKQIAGWVNEILGSGSSPDLAEVEDAVVDRIRKHWAPPEARRG